MSVQKIFKNNKKIEYKYNHTHKMHIVKDKKVHQMKADIILKIYKKSKILKQFKNKNIATQIKMIFLGK